MTHLKISRGWGLFTVCKAPKKGAGLVYISAGLVLEFRLNFSGLTSASLTINYSLEAHVHALFIHCFPLLNGFKLYCLQLDHCKVFIPY